MANPNEEPGLSRYLEYERYTTVGDWWELAGRGRFPLQVPIAVARLQKTRNLSFREAFEQLVEANAIIFLDRER